MVPDGRHAAGVALGEIRGQPLVLRRALARGHVAVQRHHVPGSELEAVVPEPGRPGIVAEVREIRRGTWRLVIVVAGRGTRARLVTPPGRVVAVAEVGGRTLRVGVVAGREDRAADPVEERRRAFGAG